MRRRPPAWARARRPRAWGRERPASLLRRRGPRRRRRPVPLLLRWSDPLLCSRSSSSEVCPTRTRRPKGRLVGSRQRGSLTGEGRPCEAPTRCLLLGLLLLGLLGLPRLRRILVARGRLVHDMDAVLAHDPLRLFD